LNHTRATCPSFCSMQWSTRHRQAFSNQKLSETFDVHLYSRNFRLQSRHRDAQAPISLMPREPDPRDCQAADQPSLKSTAGQPEVDICVFVSFVEFAVAKLPNSPADHLSDTFTSLPADVASQGHKQLSDPKTDHTPRMHSR